MIEKILVVFSAVVILLITEFIVNCMLLILFSSLYPLQKYKTIRKKYRQKNLRDRILLTYLFQYGINFKTIFTFALCWIYRISGLALIILMLLIIFASIPFSSVPAEAVYWFWEGVLFVVTIVYSKKIR